MTETKPIQRETQKKNDEKIYLASQWQLMRWKFVDHRLAVFALGIVIALYAVAAFCELLAPSDPTKRDAKHSFAKPQRVHIVHNGRLQRPFVYPLIQHINEETLARTYTEDTRRPMPIRFLAKGDAYRLWRLIPMRRHLIGLGNGERLYLMGADRLGRDLLSRILYGSRVSLSIGLVGVAMSLILGIIIGGVSGFYGGIVDTLIQRFIEILRSFPTIPLWMALAAAMPATWTQIRVYFCMTVILACIGWTDLARVVRGKILALREEDYAMAARVAGVREFSIIMRHLIPGFLSHLIVTVTLAIPGMILAETSLSFLRLGLRPPTISWGVLLQDAMNFRAVTLYPWLLFPVFFVIVTVLMFNFLGDGLRDAADPYSH
ncbi:MAG TPA: ABC transporter permease [Candidatus Hydrogenedentes bacterium]|nr:ABC transporter permease [Candidatus Hydrogenedentota bacterium]HPG67346.1 ABC transporter permease [Candidatus Hydrogenedentota bacterium]